MTDMAEQKQINHLRLLAEDDFDAACIWAENNIASLKGYFETWAKHCGASRRVFIGHTVRMIIDLET